MCACAGKRDLPPQLRQRFTEIYVPEMTAREDLQQVVLSYLRPATPAPPADAVVDFYLAVRAAAVSSFSTSGGKLNNGSPLYISSKHKAARESSEQKP